MINLRSITLRVFSQSLLFTVLAFFSFPVFAQRTTRLLPLPSPFNNLNWLNCDISDEVQQRILYEYGAVYLSIVFQNQRRRIPCRFNNETEIAILASSFKTPLNKFSFGDFYLQPQAKASLERVFRQMRGYKNVARNKNYTVTSTNDINDDWALRTYAQTQVNWRKPFETLIVPLIKDDGSKPIMFSKAIPGGSQHHLGLAVDVDEVKCGSDCQTSLNDNKWFRTVPFDAYHFTYLGFSETQLPDKGLKKVICKETKEDGTIQEFPYWIPKVRDSNYKRYEYMEVNCHAE
jgi:hypothetical protein